ncbi:hypothetical protein [Micromonospora kangleipakensis]|uniref:hypothetical protein n=1 Tax=Micromonospora kangleipakensis TaxID=1077942 RepID=UPI001028A07A|nr:hypothetical protein [Micromonospora kangleipakensis]
MPTGDVAPQEQERDVYDQLRRGRCRAAQDELNRTWFTFFTPRNVLLAQAAIYFCQGNVERGTRTFLRAKGYGWQGLLPDPEPRAACEYYKSASSLIYQRPRSAYTCPGGQSPPWTKEPRKDPVGNLSPSPLAPPEVVPPDPTESTSSQSPS